MNAPLSWFGIFEFHRYCSLQVQVKYTWTVNWCRYENCQLFTCMVTINNILAQIFGYTYYEWKKVVFPSIIIFWTGIVYLNATALYTYVRWFIMFIIQTQEVSYLAVIRLFLRARVTHLWMEVNLLLLLFLSQIL